MDQGPPFSVSQLLGFAPLPILYSILNLAPLMTFSDGTTASTREKHQQSSNYQPFSFSKYWKSFYILCFWEKGEEKYWRITGLQSIFFFFWNQQWHWSLEIVGHCICHSSMLSSEERGLLNQEESDAKLSPVFWKSSRLSVVRCTTTFQDIFWNEYQPGLGQKQNKRNQTEDCTVQWGELVILPYSFILGN